MIGSTTSNKVAFELSLTATERLLGRSNLEGDMNWIELNKATVIMKSWYKVDGVRHLHGISHLKGIRHLNGIRQLEHGSYKDEGKPIWLYDSTSFGTER